MPVKKVPKYLLFSANSLLFAGSRLAFGETDTPKPVRTYPQGKQMAAPLVRRKTYGPR